jgi:hypothetical protein
MPWYRIARMVENSVPPDGKVFALSAPPASYCTREVLGSYECAQSNNLFDMVRMVMAPEWQPTRRLIFRFPPQRLRTLRVRQLTKGTPDQWSISELRVFSGSHELARGPRWRLRAYPNPWEVQMAFDNSPVTRWRSWQPVFGGEFVEVDFGTEANIDAVALDTTPDQWTTRLRLEARGERGSWRVLSAEPVAVEVPPALEMRRLITRELRWEGFSYLMACDWDPGAADLRERTAEWGLTLVNETSGARLYSIH